MRSGFIDPYVQCPLYYKEGTNEERKIYCDGYQKGVYIHLYFRKTAQKKLHKKLYCKNVDGYEQCPLYKSILEFYKEDKNE